MSCAEEFQVIYIDTHLSGPLKRWHIAPHLLNVSHVGLQGDPTSASERRPVLGVHWKD